MRTSCSKLAAVVCLAQVLAGTPVGAADDIDTFRLEAMDRSRLYGPFELASGRRVFIGVQAYEVIVDARKQLKFKSLATEEMFGPFDFLEGRIVKLGDDYYTLVDLRRVPAPRHVPQQPAVAPTAPSAPPVEPVRAPEPVGPAAPPAVRKPVRGDGSGTRPAPVPPARPAAPAALQPRSAAFPSGEAGVELSALDRTFYDADVGGLISISETTIERQSLSVFCRRRPVKLSAGVTFNSEWSDKATGPPQTFEEAALEDGKGWWVALQLGYDLYQDASWEVTVYGDASYLREAYTLKYGERVDTLLYIPGGTNGEGTVESILEVRDTEEDATLSELVLRVGTRLSYHGQGWWCYGSVEVIPLAETDLSGSITTANGSFEIELDRSLPLTALGGAGITLDAFRIYAECRVGEEQRLSFGVIHDF